MSSDHHSPAAGTLEAVLERLVAALPGLKDATCDRIYQELDAYADIDRDTLGAAVDRNMRTTLTALRTRAVPAPRTLGGAAQTASERFEAGLRVEEIVRAFRISIALIHELFVDLAIQTGMPVDEVVDGSRLMWGVADSFTTRIITEYHELEVSSALRDAQRRVALVKSLLAGDPGAAARARLDAGWAWAAIRCDLSGTHRPESVRRRVEASGSIGHRRAIVVLEDDECLGVVARRPADPEVPVGIGPFVAPAELARSHEVAQECLRLARHLGRTGVQSSDELGWRLAAAARPDVTRTYHQRYVAPLAEQGEFGVDVLRAVEHWLRVGTSVSRTAQELSLHVNTVRYRLGRYQQLTGVDLADPEHRIGLLWALEMGDPDASSL